ncbi:nuclear RNA export factor 1/2 [Trypanosoma grayi]|uniref:nuclear RNA export factor 1/2 n=1 Tax=Trypanosoma grayi TaxID=71804 RepID=UPI0004F42623|nr:nuclear RNA export factor 1/2 [Trypanosoma grayi]KEG11885.1 nuclear RNA export factor 1/2 [Trypanosoma grayi]
MSAPYKKKKDTSNVPCIHFQKGMCRNPRCMYKHVRVQQTDGKSGVIGAASAGKGPTDAATNVLSTMLKLVFEKQQQRVYDAATGMLDLRELKKLPDLHDVAGSINFNTQSFCRALCTTIKSLIVPPPSALQLKGNNITSIYHIANQLEKEELHLSLRAISLESNEIKAVDSLQELRNFTNLQELVLAGNPAAEASDYRNRVKKMIPFLLGLDGESMMAPPLALPWPQFVGSQYSDAQRHVLQFVECALLKPLEMDETSEEIVRRGVDAVSDIYAPNSILTISLPSQEAAVSLPAKTTSGKPVTSQQRNVIREIVGLRLRQTESNHNLMQGIKSSVVACGRTKVCLQLEHWLYPKNYDVKHLIHSSASASFLDNTYLDGPSTVAMKTPVTVVTIHGVMVWSYNNPENPRSLDRVVIQRNFSRVITVSQSEAGRWLITNDMVSLYPFAGLSAHPPGPGSAADIAEVANDAGECRILFDPRIDRVRAEPLSRQKNVPVEVVVELSKHVNSDVELITVLNDLGGVPLSMFEHCALLAQTDTLESIQVCRIGNRFGLPPHEGLELLRAVGGSWVAVEEAMAARGM